MMIHPLLYTHPDTTALRTTQQLRMPTLRRSGFGIPTSAANVPMSLMDYAESGPSGCVVLRLLPEQGLPGGRRR